MRKRLWMFSICVLTYHFKCKPFDAASRGIFLEKLGVPSLDRCVAHWMKNWLKGWAEIITVNEVHHSWLPVNITAKMFLKAQYQGQFCFMFFTVIWMNGLSTPSVNLKMTLNCMRLLMSLRVGRFVHLWHYNNLEYLCKHLLAIQRKILHRSWLKVHY